MTAYATLAAFRSRLSGDTPVMSGAWDETIVDILAQVSDVIDEEVRNLRGQPPGWSFLASSAYGVQVVSISGKATGTFTLTSGSSTTVAIDAAASAATVQAALDTILGSGNSVVTGAPGGPWTVTFAGTLTGAQDVLVPVSTFTPTTAHAVVEEIVTGSVDSVTRRYTGTSGSDLVLIDDCVSVSAVSILTATGAVAQTLTLNTDYVTVPLQGSPIIGLRLTYGTWPGYPGGVSVTMRPGFGLTIPPSITRVALQEAIRGYRGAQAGEDDRLGLTPFGSVAVSKALLASSARTLSRFRLGAGFLRSGF